MQRSGAVLAKKDGVTGTSNLTIYQIGERDNTNSKHGSTLDELNNELAELLVIYAKAGGQIFGVTINDEVPGWGTTHVLVLPAVKSRNIYSLAPVDGIKEVEEKNV